MTPPEFIYDRDTVERMCILLNKKSAKRMKLDTLQESIVAFSQALLTRESSGHLYKYRITANFAKQWISDTEDFAAMYDHALESDVTRRWWKREHYHPKEMMLLFIRTEEQYAREAFKELFNESKQVENRVDRFVFYCDELLRMYKRSNPTRIENNHYQDSAIISLYLAGMYPDKYALYPGRAVFNAALRALHTKESDDKDDLSRFFKLSRTIYQFLCKNSGVLAALESGVRPAGNLLLVHEFLYFLAGRWQETTP